MVGYRRNKTFNPDSEFFITIVTDKRKTWFTTDADLEIARDAMGLTEIKNLFPATGLTGLHKRQPHPVTAGEFPGCATLYGAWIKAEKSPTSPILITTIPNYYNP